MSWLQGFRERLVDRFHSARRDAELDEEMRYHIELEIDKQRALGADLATARARALDRFGNPHSVSDAARDVRGSNNLEGTMSDLRWSIRTFARNRGFASLSIITVALGICATSVSFSVLDTVLLRSLPYRQPERLVVLEELSSKQTELAPSYPNFNDWREQNHSFEGVASAMYQYNGTVMLGSEPTQVSIMGVSRNFFAIVGLSVIEGREFTNEEQTNGHATALMVSYDFWRTSMGGRKELGTIRWDDESVPVVGVVAPGLHLVGDPQLFAPHERGAGTIRTAHNYVVVARLKPNVSVEAARLDMTGISRALKATYGAETQAENVAITPLQTYLVGDYRTLMLVVFGAATLVLLVACTNLLSAQLARGLVRAREIAVRTALGASRGRLIRQLLIESGTLTVCGALLGILMTAGLTAVVRTVGVGLLPRLDELSVDGRVLGFAVIVTAMTTVLIGVYPALRLSRRAPGKSLRGGARNSGTAVRAPVWAVLVSVQVALAVVLLVGASLLQQTLRNILGADTGFDSHGLVTAIIDLSRSSPTELLRMQRELAGMPAVEGVAYTSQLPLSWGNISAPVVRPTDPANVWPAMAGFRVVSPEYFSVMRQPLVRGRAFSSADVASGVPVAIVTPGIAKALWPNEDPVGKLVRTNYLADQWLTVVGVVAEASNWSMTRGSQNEIYTSTNQQTNLGTNQLVAVMRGRVATSTLIPMVRERIKSIAPLLGPRFGSLSERIERSAADRRFAMVALQLFAFVALVLAGIGIYGVVSYAVAARTHEIGVRMALGATPNSMLLQVLRRASTLALSGAAIGVVSGIFATRYLRSMLYGISNLDPKPYAIGITCLMLAALAGAYIPARRSSKVDPLQAMRAD